MAVDLEKLVVSLEANIRKFEREMARSRQVADRSTRDIVAVVTRGGREVEAAMAGIGSRVQVAFSAALSGLSIEQFRRLTDEFTKVQNALKTTGLEGGELAKTYDTLFQAAQRQSAPLESMVQLYSRLSLAQKELNVSTPDLLRFTEGVGLALRVQGTSAQEASGALLQLSQALGGGKVQAEEFNSLIDGAPALLRTAAEGMVEAGGSVAKLRDLVKDGKVSSEAFFRAFLAGLPQLQGQAAATAGTTEQAFQRIKNSLLNLAGELNSTVQASATAGSWLTGVADAIDNIAKKVPGAIEALKRLNAATSGSLGLAFGVGGPSPEALAQSVTIDEARRLDADRNARERRALEAAALTPNGVGGAAAQERARRDLAAFEEAQQAAREMEAARQRLRAPPPGLQPPTVGTPGGGGPINRISLKDYAPKPDGAGGAGRGGRSGRSGAERANELEREIEQIERRTRALDSERTSVGQSAAAAAEAEAKFRLLESAKKANVEVTPALMADIDRVAAAYGRATDQVQRAEEAQRAFASASSEIGSTLSTAFKDAILNGERLSDVMSKLLKSLASRGIDTLFNQLLGGGSGGGGGLVGSLLSGLGARGGGTPPARSGGGQVKAGGLYGVNELGREQFVPLSPGRVVSNRDLRRGGGANVTIIDQRSNQAAAPEVQRGPGGDVRVVLRDMVRSEVTSEAGRNGSFARAIGAPGNFRG